MIYYRLGSSQLAEQILEDDTSHFRNYTNQNLKIEKTEDLRMGIIIRETETSLRNFILNMEITSPIAIRHI
jgi:hypothetical protein